MLLSQSQISVLSGDHELVHTEHVKLCYVVLPNESFDSSSDNSSLKFTYCRHLHLGIFKDSINLAN